MPTLLSTFNAVAGEIKLRYQEPYVTEGFNAAKAVIVPRGTHRGFRLGTNDAAMSVSIVPDPTWGDHVAQYLTTDANDPLGYGHTLTIRRVGGEFTVSLSALPSSVVVIAIQAIYGIGNETSAVLNAYTLSEYESLLSDQSSELIVLGVVTTPGSGVIPAANIVHSMRVFAGNEFGQDAVPFIRLADDPAFSQVGFPTNTSIAGIDGMTWYFNNESTDVVGEWIQSGSSGNQLSLSVTTLGTVSFEFYPRQPAITVQEGQVLRVRIDLKALQVPSSGSLQIGATYRNITGGSVSTIDAYTIPITGVDSDFRTIDQDFAVPQGATYITKIKLYSTGVAFPASGAFLTVEAFQVWLETLGTLNEADGGMRPARMQLSTVRLPVLGNVPNPGDPIFTNPGDGTATFKRADDQYTSSALAPNLVVAATLSAGTVVTGVTRDGVDGRGSGTGAGGNFVGGTNGAGGVGVIAQAGGTNAPGVGATGTGTGHGIDATGGSSGATEDGNSNGAGVYGLGGPGGSYGVYGQGTYDSGAATPYAGVYGTTIYTDGIGVEGQAGPSGAGVVGIGHEGGLPAPSAYAGVGVFGQAGSGTNDGVIGQGTGGGSGVHGFAGPTGAGVRGQGGSTSGAGGYFTTNGIGDGVDAYGGNSSTTSVNAGMGVLARGGTASNGSNTGGVGLQAVGGNAGGSGHTGNGADGVDSTGGNAVGSETGYGGNGGTFTGGSGYFGSGIGLYGLGGIDAGSGGGAGGYFVGGNDLGNGGGSGVVGHGAGSGWGGLFTGGTGSTAGVQASAGTGSNGDGVDGFGDREGIGVYGVGGFLGGDQGAGILGVGGGGTKPTYGDYSGAGVFGQGGAGSNNGVIGQGTGTGPGVAGIGGPTAEWGGYFAAGSGSEGSGLVGLADGASAPTGDGFAGLVGVGADIGQGVIGIGGNGNREFAFYEGTGGFFQGGTHGPGVWGIGGTTGSPNGVNGQGGAPNGIGVDGAGTGSGAGVNGTGGVTGGGVVGTGGTASGDGGYFTAQAGNSYGVHAFASGTASGVKGEGGPTGASGDGNSNGTGVYGQGGSGGSYGLYGNGSGFYAGVYGKSYGGAGGEFVGSIASPGVTATGGSSGGDGIDATGGSDANGGTFTGTGLGAGVSCTGGTEGSSGWGIIATAGSGSGAHGGVFQGDGGGNGIAATGGSNGSGGTFYQGSTTNDCVVLSTGPLLISENASATGGGGLISNRLWANNIAKVVGAITTDGNGHVTAVNGYGLNGNPSISSGVELTVNMVTSLDTPYAIVGAYAYDSYGDFCFMEATIVSGTRFTIELTAIGVLDNTMSFSTGGIPLTVSFVVFGTH